MTPTRKRSLELARLLLEDAAADPALPGGNRERFLMMAARIATEAEIIEGVSSSIYQVQPEEPAEVQVVKAVRPSHTPVQPAPPKPIEPSACSGKFSNHRWLNSPVCVRCGAER